MGLFFFWKATVEPLWWISAARSWEATPCTILSSEVKKSRGSKGSTNYRSSVTYRYRFAGRVHTSSRVHFATMSSSGRGASARLLKRFPPGMETVCFVDPRNPAEAVLDRGASRDLWSGAFALVFVAVGLGGIIFAPRLAGGRRPMQGRTGVPAVVEAEAVLLQPAVRPLAKVLLPLVFALFWNAAVSTMVVQVVKSFQRGKPEWVLALFAAPFAAVGLLIIAFLLHALLGLLNPRVRIVAGAAVPLGGELEVRWETAGGLRSLRRLRITVEAREEVTVGTGKHRRVERNVFALLPVAETEQADEIRAGAARVRIPAGLVHSFDGGVNKILWLLKVRGTVPRFPSVADDYALSVLPFPVAGRAT
jgi:hypothetical protein